MAKDLGRKDGIKIVKGLEDQGAVVKVTKMGWLILFPNGNTTSLHSSGSDVRGLLNFKADIRRAGLEWPLQRGFKV